MWAALELARARRRSARSEAHFAAPEPAPGRPRGTDCLPQIQHVVVLMMENHSYDSYLGMLAGRGDGFSLGPDGLPVETNPGVDGRPVALRRRPTRQVPDVPSQSWYASHLQFAGGRCDGFVRSVEETMPGADRTMPMSYWTESDLPFYYGLARTFPLATRWFSSCLGPTFPNRRFLVAGTAHGLADDLAFGLGDYPPAGTIFDTLSANGISWANYHHLSPVGVRLRGLAHSGGLFRYPRELEGLAANLGPQVSRRLESKLQATAALYPLGLLRTVNHLRPVRRFWEDARSGRLPAVSIVDPDFGTCSEENPQDIQVGEGFAARVINAVMSGPAWPRTLLIWLYDEHGGYFDHVPPPEAPAPDSVPARNPARNGVLGWLLRRTAFGARVDMADRGPSGYDRLGFRVPAVVVSPYARPGYVSTEVFDHTSVLKLLETKWNLPALTARDAAAVAPLDCLDFNSEPAFLVPPQLPAPARPWDG